MVNIAKTRKIQGQIKDVHYVRSALYGGIYLNAKIIQFLKIANVKLLRQQEKFLV